MNVLTEILKWIRAASISIVGKSLIDALANNKERLAYRRLLSLEHPGIELSANDAPRAWSAKGGEKSGQ